MQRVLCQCFNIIYFFIDENCLCLTDGECFFSNLQCKIVLKNPIYNCPPLTACRSKSFTRVCHPFPLLRRASKTSASRRMLSTFFAASIICDLPNGKAAYLKVAPLSELGNRLCRFYHRELNWLHI